MSVWREFGNFRRGAVFGGAVFGGAVFGGLL